MASGIITCPECKKKFKGKDDLYGKKIRCPFCKEAFVVEKDEEAVTIPPSGAKTAAKKPEAKAQPIPTAGGEDDDEFDQASNPYGITKLDLAPRCPNCANEMENETAVVCLFCGYNTLLRTWGKTRKVIELTFGDYLKHLLPGLLAVLCVLIMIGGTIYYCLVLPYVKKWAWLDMLTDHESTRLWMASLALFICWGMGYYAFNRIVMNPKPPDKVKQ